MDRNYLKNVSWQGLGNMSAQAVNLVSLPIIARLFSPTDIGFLGMFVEALAIITILMSFRVEHIILLPKEDSVAQALTSFVFCFGAISCVGLVLLALLLSLFGVVPGEYRLWAIAVPLTAYFLVLGQALQQLSQRSANFGRSGLSEFVARLSNSIFALCAGFAGGPGAALGMAVGVGNLTKTLVFMSELSRVNRKSYQAVRRGFSEVRKHSYQRLLASLSFSHALLACTSFIPLWFVAQNWGAEYAGYLSLVLATLALPTRLIGTAVGQVFYQRAAEMFGNQEKFIGLLISNSLALLAIALPGFSIVYFFGSWLYTVVFGPQWEIAGVVAQYYVFAAALSFLSVPFDRSGLIVNAWWWGPLWHVARLVATGSVIMLSLSFHLTYYEFVKLLTLQAVVLYLLDFIASLNFSLRTERFDSSIFGWRNKSSG